MQSFASPPPFPPPQIMQHKTCSIIYATHFMPHLHRKGATIASPQEKSLLNRLNRCEPKSTHKSGIGVSLKCPPTSVRFPTLKSKTCEICGIRVSPKNATKAWTRVKKKGSEDGVGTTSFGAFP